MLSEQLLTFQVNISHLNATYCLYIYHCQSRLTVELFPASNQNVNINMTHRPKLRQLEVPERCSNVNVHVYLAIQTSIILGFGNGQ